jgi:hypothetical protein
MGDCTHGRVTMASDVGRGAAVPSSAHGERLTDELAARRWWPTLVPLALLAIAVSLLVPAGRHQWALALIRQPTLYTALWFNNASALPVSAVRGRPMTLSFSVANHEGKVVTYRYVVRQEVGGKSQVLAQASRAVNANTTWSVSAQVSPSCRSSPCRLAVSLPGHPETIDLLLTITARPANG